MNVNKPPVWLIAAAIIPRIFFLFLGWQRPEALLLSDSSRYLALANNLGAHHVFSMGPAPYAPETLRMPGYPLFLAPFTQLFSRPEIAVALVQTLLALFTIWMAWRWLYQLAGGRGAIFGTLALSVDLVTLFHTPMVLAEPLVLCLQMLALLATWLALPGTQLKRIVASGIVWGLTMLVKPVFLFMPVVLSIAWAKQRKWVFIFLVSAYFLPGCWVVRNYLKANFWGLTSQGGMALLQYPAASIQSALSERPWAEVQADLTRQVDQAYSGSYRGDAELNKAYGEAAKRIIMAHPWLFIRSNIIGAVQILAGTGASMWSLYLPLNFQFGHVWSFSALTHENWSLIKKHIWIFPVQLAYAIGLGFFYLYTLVGAIRLWKAGRRIEMVILTFASIYLLALAAHQGYSRFRIPMMPFMAGAFAFAFANKPVERKSS